MNYVIEEVSQLYRSEQIIIVIMLPMHFCLALKVDFESDRLIISLHIKKKKKTKLIICYI